jgi:hypothetical protein
MTFRPNGHLSARISEPHKARITVIVSYSYSWGVFRVVAIPCSHAVVIWSLLLLYDNKSSTSNTKVRGLLRVSTSCAHVGSGRRSAAIGNNISDIPIARGVHRCVVVVRRMRSHTTLVTHTSLGTPSAKYLRGSRNCDETPTTIEPLPGDQITTQPLETAPLVVELATKRVTIIAFRCRPINRGAEHSQFQPHWSLSAGTTCLVWNSRRTLIEGLLPPYIPKECNSRPLAPTLVSKCG